MILFKKFRKRDINIEVEIGLEERELDFYIFEEKALNTFDPEIAIQRQKLNPLQETKKVKIKNINTIFKDYLPKDQKIDLLNIDVEGLDLEILKSINWEKYSPQVILVESYRYDLNMDPIYIFMVSQGYKFHAKTTRTLIFAKDKKY